MRETFEIYLLDYLRRYKHLKKQTNKQEENNSNDRYKYYIPKRKEHRITQTLFRKQINNIIDHKRFKYCCGAEGLYVLHISFSKWYFSFQESCITASKEEFIREL